MGQDSLAWRRGFDRNRVAVVQFWHGEAVEPRPEFFWRRQENVDKRQEKFRNRKQTLATP